MILRIFMFAMLFIHCTNRNKPKDISEIKREQDSLRILEESNQEQDSRDRTIWQKPYDIIHMMGSLEGKTIADIGAGSGYFSFRFIYEAAHVIAIDIVPELIQLMDQERKFYKSELQDKFEARLATPNDPKLNPNEVDIVFIANTFKYIPDRINYLRNLKSKFKADGRIMIVDFKKKMTPIGPLQKNRMAQSEVEQELMDAGYKLILSDDLKLEYQYIIIAVPE
ncbi:MAG: methyltransferase domain-containing protein [Saprospiraceae bacterium]|nr:methyltransferase domain-containing protein [Saprospiraceae bacterium]MBK9221238.1 methyltransferase domain-containing protein [Saprospiraceae bacterium]MBK9721827.1 methyltransferase domain-containing protein [Saprospiraceae bacterium]MBK9728888.1 methyltransferase domain-containing protein [Saprospiraceae bacterium]